MIDVHAYRHGESRAFLTRMLERYTHPTNARKVDALETFAAVDGPNLGRTENGDAKKSGGRQEAELPTSALRTRRSPN